MQKVYLTKLKTPSWLKKKKKQLEMKGKFLNLIKVICDKFIVNGIVNSEILNSFLLLLETSKMHHSHHSYLTVY